MMRITGARLSLMLVLLHTSANAGELGNRAFCRHHVENLRLTLLSETIADNGVGYKLQLRAEGRSHGFKNLFGGFVALGEKPVVSATKPIDASNEVTIYNFLDDLELSGGVLADDHLFFELVRRQDQLVVIWTKVSGLPFDLPSEPGLGERVIGQIDRDTGVIQLTDSQVQLFYVESAYNGFFANPHYTVEGGYIELSFGARSWFGDEHTHQGCSY